MSKVRKVEISNIARTLALDKFDCADHSLQYLKRKERRHKPTAHISYDLGLHLVRKFVNYSSLHTIEELQAFTSQWVPAPTWVRVNDIEISKEKLELASKHLQRQLGPDGLELIGGKEWWQWRRDNAALKAEWIEMRSDYHERKAKGEKGSRVMLYVHGGAFYFGSVDEHRYQIQRHARKLKARCLAPRYRLAPQFPFPCGLYDCLAAYLHLLDEFEPSNILIAGDSAGGGMATSLLVILRDQNIPLPAGAILLSPWVDLMHSFPSIADDGTLDYIPSNGFIHKPSISWPPPTAEPGETMPSGVAAAQESSTNASKGDARDAALMPGDAAKVAERGFSKVPAAAIDSKSGPSTRSLTSIKIDDKVVEIRDQIQIYAPNHLLTHPLVSPVLQPSLGGLPPILIQVGGGEMLRDEQIYLAHKAARPLQYPSSNEILDKHDPKRKQMKRYRPTNVQLQVWEDICHVGHTLSWTHPAKYMYRSVAQFGAWALAHAQKTAIDFIDEVDESDIESSASDDEGPRQPRSPKMKTRDTNESSNLTESQGSQVSESIGKAGDPLPAFDNHMIRQRVDRHGRIYELGPPSELAALQMRPSDIGALKEAPVRKWLQRQEEWNRKFASTKKQLQKQIAKQRADGYVGLPEGEKPPPTALAGRRTKDMPLLQKTKKSLGMSMWSSWGSKHDRTTVEQGNADDLTTTETPKVEGASSARDMPVIHEESRARSSSAHSGSKSRARSTSRIVHDEGQATEEDKGLHTKDGFLMPTSLVDRTPAVADTVIPSTNTTSTRPTHDGIAYPFKLQAPKHLMQSVNPSMVTLKSENQEIENGESDLESPIVGDDEGQQTLTAAKERVIADHLDEKRAEDALDSDDANLSGPSLADEARSTELNEKSPLTMNATASGAGDGDEASTVAKRPSMERFVTAAEF